MSIPGQTEYLRLQVPRTSDGITNVTQQGEGDNLKMLYDEYHAPIGALPYYEQKNRNLPPNLRVKIERLYDDTPPPAPRQKGSQPIRRSAEAVQQENEDLKQRLEKLERLFLAQQPNPNAGATPAMVEADAPPFEDEPENDDPFANEGAQETAVAAPVKNKGGRPRSNG